LGEAYLGTKEPDKVLPELEAASELKPKDDEIELAYAKGLAAVGRKADAKTHLQAILERDAKNAEERAELEAIK
jgi:thioredoxin-like negative regulator of GroEL